MYTAGFSKNKTESGIEIPELEDIVFLPNLSNTFEFKIEEKDRLKVEILNFLKDKTIIPYFSYPENQYRWTTATVADHNLYILQGIENTNDGFRIDFGALTKPSYRKESDFVSLSRRTKFAFLQSVKPEKNGGHYIKGLYLSSLIHNPSEAHLETNPWAVSIDSKIYLPVDKPTNLYKSEYLLNLC